MNDKTIYTEDSIKSISPREFTRTRPGVYAGSVEYSTQLVREAFANALDEHLIGHGNNIQVLVNTESNTYTVQDEAQGFPVNKKRDDGETILSASFSVLNTSGKYDEDGVYGGSVRGLNGIGAKLICYLSSYSDVLTTDGSGEYEHVWYKDGLFVKREVTKAPKGVHGTSITWTPDPQFFHNKQINFDETRKLFKEISVLCPSLTISLIVDGKEEIYHSENGLKDLVDEKVKGKELLSNRFYCKKIKGDNLFDICLTYTDGYSEDMTAYVNYGLTDGGVHITNLHSLITRNINKAAREKKLLKEKDENLTGQELTEGLVIVFNLKANGVQYDSQSKTRIVDIDKTLLNETITEDFYQWLIYNEKELKAIVEKALLARKAREAAKKAKDAVRNVNKKKEKALKFDSKLADCFSKDRTKCELYITEGDSASGNLKTARNNEFQAVMPIRGKIINTQKATLAQIQKNAEIMTMIDAFGLYIDPKTMKITYDASSLRYGKIIIMSDADVDGAHIKNLFYTFVWNFCPQLIIDGYIYAGVPPLYKITTGKTYKYLKNDEALEEYRRLNAGKTYVVSRLKGLGEMDVNETEETLTNPENRIIKQITVEDIQQTNALFEDLMGQGVTARKLYIKAHSKEAAYNEE